jgi:hypothetical protein
MFVVSVAFFVVGILVTVFGFGGGGGAGAGMVTGSGGSEGTAGTDVGNSAVSSPDLDERTSRHALPMQVTFIYLSRQSFMHL